MTPFTDANLPRAARRPTIRPIPRPADGSVAARLEGLTAEQGAALKALLAGERSTLGMPLPLVPPQAEGLLPGQV